MDQISLDDTSAARGMVTVQRNVQDIENDLTWFASLLDTRFRLYFDREPAYASIFDLQPPDLSASDSLYARFVQSADLDFMTRLTLVLCLVPHTRPQILDIFFTRNRTFDREFTEFGGILDNQRGVFTPTGETLAFILGGDDLETRFAVQQMLTDDQSRLMRELVCIDASATFPLKAALTLAPHILAQITTGEPYRPALSVEFPAQRITTRMTWDDLVLHPVTLDHAQEIELWLTHGSTLLADPDLGRRLRPGLRALFYGPPGTGKTLTASLLGRATGRDVYRIDLSQVVSKYIGETEKNLARVLDRAEHMGWILLFDEADALFGKRTATRDAHDRYANQEVSFLLQRIEDFTGVVILATNRRDDIDDAFFRRFDTVIYFPMPRPSERLRLWQESLPARLSLADDVDLIAIADEHELTGGAIINIVRYVSLHALADGSTTIDQGLLDKGIRREYAKNGRQ